MNQQPVSYLQTDPRWSAKDYSARGEKTTIGASGCGPTAMSMVPGHLGRPPGHPGHGVRLGAGTRL